MSTMTLAPADPDVRRRARPSREQLRVAAAMFAAATEDVTSVVVPIVMTGDDRRPEYPGGYWLADHSAVGGAYGYRAARDAAEAVAEAHLRDRGGRGLPGWVSIRTDGTWAAFDGWSLSA